MPKYLFKVTYSSEGLKALHDAGAPSRVKAGLDVVASLGGSLECFYFAFGADDVYSIADLPDDEAAAAISLAGGQSGAFSSCSVTKLLTAAQVEVKPEVTAN